MILYSKISERVKIYVTKILNNFMNLISESCVLKNAVRMENNHKISNSYLLLLFINTTNSFMIRKLNTILINFICAVIKTQMASLIKTIDRSDKKTF